MMSVDKNDDKGEFYLRPML